MTDLEGIVEQIIFYNQDSAVTPWPKKLKRVPEERSTVVSLISALIPKHLLSLKGEWVGLRIRGTVQVGMEEPDSSSADQNPNLVHRSIKGSGQLPPEKSSLNSAPFLTVIQKHPERPNGIPGISLKKMRDHGGLEEHAALWIMVFDKG